jgi:Family of unknown function (DUF5677)
MILAGERPVKCEESVVGSSDIRFDSEVDRLDWLIHEVEKRAKDATVTIPDPESLDVFVVMSSWLALALSQAEAVLLLITHDLSTGAGPLQRALWELWIEWRFLLKQKDHALNAAKVTLNAELEALDAFEKMPIIAKGGRLARVQRQVKAFEAQHPEAAAQVRTQRKNRKFHWSGLSRSAMERELAPGAAVYRLLSWDAHAVMGPVRDVAVRRTATTVHFEFGRQETPADVNRSAWASGGVLFYMYNDFAKMWGLSPIIVPKSPG